MNLKRMMAIAAGALSISTAGCATVETPPPDAEPGPALWQVADGDTTIYLFGTVHALPKNTDWFSGKIQRAFAASDELVTEVDLGDPQQSGMALASAAKLPDGRNLREMMLPENRVQFEDALVELGLPVEAFDKVEPWFAAMTLSLLPVVQAGYDQQSGVELSLSGRAGEKHRSALETIDQQVDLFDKLPEDAQLTFLDEVVEGIGEAKPTLDAMVAEWLAGDAQELSTLLNAELSDPALYDRLLTQRNANWADWIERRMEQPGTVFLAVGAGHLAGKGSVQDQLDRRGMEVRRIWK